jgi:hypothetical protein
LLLAYHLGIARLGGAIFDRAPPTYAAVLAAYWSLRPYMIAVQFVLLTVAWTHAWHRPVFLAAAKTVLPLVRAFLLALGDAVNVAAQLQDLTKTLSCSAMILEEICRNAGVGYKKLDRTDVPIHGRDKPMTVRTVVDATALASLLDAQAKRRSRRRN